MEKHTHRESGISKKRFAQNLRSSRRGAAAGPSGMTTDHLRPLVEPTRFPSIVQSRRTVGSQPMDAVRLGRMMAVQKPDGGVRGIVAGEVLRRLVSRTIAQQIMPAVERFTSPFQYALRGRERARSVRCRL